MNYLKSYPKYKTSGVEWLGDVPSNWTLKKVAWIMKISIGWTPPTGRHDFYGGQHNWVTISDMSSGRIKQTKSTITDAAIRNKGARPAPTGSLLFSYKLSVGEVALLDSPAFTNEAIAAFHPVDEVKSDFWAYAAPVILPKSGRENIYGALLLNQESMNDTRIYLPPKAEQILIAKALDRETGRIDALVEEKTKFIELMKEKRQVLITQAVTKGLDPNVKMKDSGVEWIGGVPEHWEVKKIGALYRETSDSGDEKLPVLSISIHHGASKGESKDDKLKRKVTRIEDKTKYKRVCAGDLVYNMMRAWQGGFGAILVSGLVSPAYVVARPLKENISSQFVEYLLRTSNAIEEMHRLSHGITDFRLRLYWEKFKTMSIILPAPSEQESILKFIFCETAHIDSLVEEVMKSIELLKERRSALITAAVTGKIDVRETK